MKKLFTSVVSLLMSLIILFGSGLGIKWPEWLNSMHIEAKAVTEAYAYDGHMYQVFNEYLTWRDAKDYCQSVGGHLVTITSAGEQNFLENLLLNGTKIRYWLGLTDELTEGTWKWITGETYSFNNWYSGEPNNGQGWQQEDYGTIYAKGISPATAYGHWNDEYGLYNYVAFICEWETFEAYNEAKSNRSYSIKILDVGTLLPIAGATVAVNGMSYVTRNDGSCEMTICNLTSLSITISRNGYKTVSKYIFKLNPYTQSIIYLEPSISWGQALADMLGDVALDAERVCGPTVNILGNSFPLFSFDAKVEIGGFTFKYKQNTQKKTVEYIIGVKDDYTYNSDSKWNEDYSKFKDFYKCIGNCSDQQTLNKYRDLRNLLKDTDGDLGFKCGIRYAGYAEFDYSTGSLVFKEGGFVATAEAKVSTDVPFWGVFYATFSIGGEIEGKIFISREDEGVLGMNTSITLAVKPSLGAGIGNSKVACVEAGIEGEIKGKVKVPASTLRESLELTLSAQAYIKAKLLFLEAKWKTNFPHLELYPDFGMVNMKSMGIDENSFEMIPRSYLNKKGPSKNNSGSISEQNVYPYGSPKMSKLDDGRLVALWIYDDGTKSDANRTTLYFSVYDGEQWSAPAAVYESGKADFDPEIYTDGTNIYASWRRGTEVYADDMGLDEVLSKTQLVYSCFNGTSWTQPMVIGNFAGGKYPILHTIVSDESDVTIAWVENSLNDYSFSSGTTSIYKQQMIDGIWGTVTQTAAPSNVGSLALGIDGGSFELAYTTDMDGDSATAGDTELFLNGTRFTNNTVDDTGVTWQNNDFWYVSGGMLANVTQGVSELPVEGSYQIVENGTSTAVTFPVTDGFKNELYISYAEGGGFTTSVALTSYGKHISDYSAVMQSDGTVVAAMNVDNLSGDPDVFPFTTTDFLVEEFGTFYDLEIGDALNYDYTTIAPGADVELLTTVKNNSTAAIDGYTLTLTDSSGNLLTSKTINEILPRGAQKEVSIKYTLPATLAGHEVRISATPLADVIETDTTNNTVKTQIGLGDLSVSSHIEPNAGGALITTTVTNTGYTSTDAGTIVVKQLLDTSEILVTQTIGSLAPGQSTTITYQVSSDKLVFLSEYNAKTFMVEVSTDSEENNYANNDATVRLLPVRAQILSISNETLTMAVDEMYGLTATITPSSAANKTVYFISDSTDIAIVNKNGIITAISTGTAKITVISADGGIVKSCTVTVQSNSLTASTNGTLLMSGASGFITGINMNAYTITEIRSQISNTNIRILDQEGSVLISSDTVGTGSRVQLLNNTGSVIDAKTIVIFGDTNGDGLISAVDSDICTLVQNWMIEWDQESQDYFYKSGDINGDGNVDSIDADIITDVGNWVMGIDQATGRYYVINV